MKWYQTYLSVYEKPFDEAPKAVVEEVKKKIGRLQNINKPVVASVVAIAHNEENRVLSCLWSLCNNECSYPFEIIVINNSSTDNTENILKELQSVLLKFGIESTINKENRKGKIMRTPSGLCLVTHDMYRLYFRKKDSIRKLYDFLYKDATIFMERKKKVFDDNYFL